MRLLELAEWAKMMSDKGIYLMDRARPAWWKEVDLTILSSVAYEDDSLLCQLFGSMKTAERRIGKVAPQRMDKPFGLYWDLYGFYWGMKTRTLRC